MISNPRKSGPATMEATSGDRTSIIKIKKSLKWRQFLEDFAVLNRQNREDLSRDHKATMSIAPQRIGRIISRPNNNDQYDHRQSLYTADMDWISKEAKRSQRFCSTEKQRHTMHTVGGDCGHSSCLLVVRLLIPQLSSSSKNNQRFK